LPLTLRGIDRAHVGDAQVRRAAALVIQEIAAAADVLETSIAIAARTIRTIRPMCHGVHIMAIGWEQHIPRILKHAGL
jgi:5,10-methylenetetrahydrofolate reductase